MNLFSTNRVLVPIDFSPESFQALTDTLEFIQDPTHVYVLHVLSPLNPVEPGMVWHTTDNELRQQNVSEAFQQQFDHPDIDKINFSVKIGSPSSEILDYAKEQEIELIVIPSHGRTGLNRFLLGSVAERVVRFAHCPVLVLRRS